jgi:hypothetical protein
VALHDIPKRARDGGRAAVLHAISLRFRSALDRRICVTFVTATSSQGVELNLKHSLEIESMMLSALRMWAD